LVQETLGEHLSGRRDRHQRLWDVLMFQAWLSSESGPGAPAVSVLGPVDSLT
jgi:hypothetical protein